MKNNLKRINAGGGGPVNTMAGHSRSEPGTSTPVTDHSTLRSKKRPRESPSTAVVVELTTSRPSSKKKDVHGSMFGQMDGSRIPISAKTYAKRHRDRLKGPASRSAEMGRETDRAVESIEDDLVVSPRANEPKKRTRRSPSPDVIALNNVLDDPPPANVVFDLRDRKRPKFSRLIYHEEKRAERASGRARDDIDELQAVPARRKHSPELISDGESTNLSPRDPIKSKYFTSPKDTAKTSDKPFLRILRAASGNFCYEVGEELRSRVFLRLDPNQQQSFLAVDEKGRRVSDMPWLNMNMDQAIGVSNSKDSTYVHVKRPMTQLQPPGLSIEFGDTAEAAYFADRAKGPIRKDLEAPRLKDMVDKAILRASARPDLKVATIHAPEQGKDSYQSVATRDRSCSPELSAQAKHRGKDDTRGTKLKDQMSISNTARTARRASAQQSPRSPELRLRQTRSSLPSIPVEEDFVRWTSLHPDWTRDWHQSLVWPPTGRNRTTVDEADIYRLDEGEFLNDNLINFWLRNIQYQLEANDPDMLKRVYFFSTFFFEKLKYSNGKIDYSGVRTWTAKVDVFSYDYLIVPVNENAHWYLAIICNPGKLLPKEPVQVIEAASTAADSQKVDTIEQRLSEVSIADGNARRTLNSKSSKSSQDDDTVKNREESPKATPKRKGGSGKAKADTGEPRIITLDSLGSGHPRTVAALKTYLIEEAKDKKQVADIALPLGMKAKSIPQQDNWCDCGIYVLAYAREFLGAPDETLRRILHKEPTGWKVNASEERKSIRQLLFTLQARQHKNLEAERAEKMAKRQAKRNGATASRKKARLLPQGPEEEKAGAQDADQEANLQAEAGDKSVQNGGGVNAASRSPCRSDTSRQSASASASAIASPRGEVPKDTSSTNSFHTANSSPRLGDSAESLPTPLAANEDDEPIVLIEEAAPDIKKKVDLIQELPSSPTAKEEDGRSTPRTWETGKRKRVIEITGSPSATTQRPRKFVRQIADLQKGPKESIEVQDDDGARPGNAVEYDGIDREEVAD
ncbi:Ulp1 protease family protein [Sarocladium implicatum]|nr:Ulp1 protease family protein [Sarocladium implicatum]